MQISEQQHAKQAGSFAAVRTIALWERDRGATREPAGAVCARPLDALPALFADAPLSKAVHDLRRCFELLESATARAPLPETEVDVGPKTALDQDAGTVGTTEWLEDEDAAASMPATPADADALFTELASDPRLTEVANATASLPIYLAELRAIPVLDAVQELALAHRVRAGDSDAKATMIRVHLGVVVSVARSFRRSGMPLEDLISDGNMGLMEAIGRFDLERGVRFASYARFWIKQSIRQGILDHSRTVRLPVHVIRDVTKVLREQRKGPAAAEVASTAQEPQPANPQPTSELQRVATATGKSLDDVSRLLRHAQQPLSIDMPIGSDESTTLADSIVDQEGGTPESQMIGDQMLRGLMAAIDTLSKPERTVILRRYGFADGEPATLEEVGSILNLTAERVRQIQKGALPKLRAELLRRGIDAAALFT